MESTRKVIVNGIAVPIIDSNETVKTDYFIDEHKKEVMYQYESNNEHEGTTGIGSLQLLRSNKNSSVSCPIKEHGFLDETSKNVDSNQVKPSDGEVVCIHCMQAFSSIKDVESHVCVSEKGIKFEVVYLGEADDGTSCPETVSNIEEGFNSESSVDSTVAVQSVSETESSNNEHFEITEISNPINYCCSRPTEKRNFDMFSSSNQVKNNLIESSEAIGLPDTNGESSPSSPDSLLQMNFDSLFVELNGPYKCKYCEEVFSDQATLYVHTKVHWKRKQFICKRCWMRFPSEDKRRRHMALHGLGHQCNKCRRPFGTEDELETHLKTHRGSVVIVGPYLEARSCDLYASCEYERQTYFCYECSLCFYSQMLFNIHKCNWRHRFDGNKRRENLSKSDEPSSYENENHLGPKKKQRTECDTTSEDDLIVTVTEESCDALYDSNGTSNEAASVGTNEESVNKGKRSFEPEVITLD